jgi:hypothetical protein
MDNRSSFKEDCKDLLACASYLIFWLGGFPVVAIGGNALQEFVETSFLEPYFDFLFKNFSDFVLTLFFQIPIFTVWALIFSSFLIFVLKEKEQSFCGIVKDFFKHHI